MRLKLVFFTLFSIFAAWGGGHALIWAAGTDGDALLPHEDWEVLSSDAGIEVASRPIAGSDFKAYRAKGILSAPIEQILEVLRDTAAAGEWIPGMARQQVVAEISAVELVTLSIYAVPFPFADREFLLHNQLRLDRKRGALMAEAVSIDSPEVPVSDARVRAHMYRGQTWLRPLSKDQTEVEFLLMAEPRGRIPVFIASFGLRHMPFKFLKALEYRAQKSDYPLRPVYRDLIWQLAKTNRVIQDVGRYQPTDRSIDENNLARSVIK